MRLMHSPVRDSSRVSLCADRHRAERVSRFGIEEMQVGRIEHEIGALAEDNRSEARKPGVEFDPGDVESNEGL
jgi:hypothetical protein